MAESDKHTIEELIHRLESLPDPMDPHGSDLTEIFRLFSLFYELITEFRNINFTSLFSRLVFAGVHYKLSGGLMFESHYFRRACESPASSGLKDRDLYQLGSKVLWQAIHEIFGTKIPVEVKERSFELDRPEKVSHKKFERVVRAILLDVNILEDGILELIYCSEEDAHVKKKAVLKSEIFSRQVLRLKQHIGIDTTVSLVDVNYLKERTEVSAIVIRPDFLIGVTSISECFQNGSSLAISALAKKLIPIESSKYLLMGNVVNYLLDELMHRTDLGFDILLKEIFRISPIEFAQMSDQGLREFIDKLSKHFLNLKSIIRNDFSEAGIKEDKAFLEPSFYSNEYGIQGRLDLYHYDSTKNQSDIIELKSGKVYKPNAYGLNENHYVQTLLYDLMVESVHNAKVKSNNYIMYSFLDEKNLRYAPRVRSKQYEALYVRNDLILIEEVLTSDDVGKLKNLISYFDDEKIPSEFNFLSRDARMFKSVFSALTELERSYYLHFVGFLSREYQLSKTGRHGLYSDNGLASLWLDKMQDKIDRFSILAYLRIEENRAAEENPILRLKFSKKSSLLSRFRKGDIAVLYPDDGAEHSVLKHQIFKCTITALNSEGLELRLRSRQKNYELFENYEYWHIEQDVLDSSILKQFHGLYYMAKSPLAFRQKILCLEAPENYRIEQSYFAEGLTEEQSEIINKAISSKDYFLIWGPPGTGKTSVIIRSLMDHYHNWTDLHVLLLAYTNRAVDEICEAIEEVLDGNFIRIGSRYSTRDKYQSKLFGSVTENIHSRKELVDRIQDQRVFVSTISSFQGMRELNNLKHFDLVIVDEASQILEPMIVGLLCEFDKFILIGDHKQLPAVVTQDPERSLVQDDVLIERCGLTDMSNSLFERMYLQSIRNNWDWAYSSLSKQGRMHQDILNFVSQNFYEGHLDIMRNLDRLVKDAELNSFDKLSKIMITERMIFVDTPISEEITQKTNRLEAQLVDKTLAYWTKIYKYNELELHHESLGVITPFRSQIATIKEFIDKKAYSKRVSVDTVERYQGSSRDRVIISLAVSKADMLDSISKPSKEGIDRKLNVALTRAKENVLIFGNRSILEKSLIYKKLLDACYHLDPNEILNLA